MNDINQPPVAKKPTKFTARASQNPLVSLPTNADHAWNADTGASAHMTPHLNWLQNYQPKCMPIKLADNMIIYLEGIRLILFHPKINGKELRKVEISQVILQNNL